MTEVSRALRQNTTDAHQSVHAISRYSRIIPSVAAKSNVVRVGAGAIEYSACCMTCAQPMGELTESVLACIRAC